MKWWLLLALWMAVPLTACMWDSDTLRSEKRKRPSIAALINGKLSAKVDHKELQARIERLLRSPRPSDTNWVNELGGAYLRTGQPAKAAELLEPAAKQFPNDYGVHANLGTAYHLLGRYKDAERHIARDLEINPDAHFGLEKYHLALLQYLSRDAAYQKAHVYVDESTSAFNGKPSPRIEHLGEAESRFAYGAWQNVVWSGREAEVTRLKAAYHKELHNEDALPYRFQWNLAEDKNFLRGVEYMAELNPKEPAVWVMLGIACMVEKDKNLAIACFRKAIALGSEQTDKLDGWISALESHIAEAQRYKGGWRTKLMRHEWAVLISTGPLLLALCVLIRRRRAAVRENRSE